MSAAKTWNVYDIVLDEIVFTGTRRQISDYINMPRLKTNSDRIYPGRVYQGRYMMDLATNNDLSKFHKHKKKLEPLPGWAKGSRMFYQSVMEMKSTLLMSGTFGLNYTTDGTKYIEPLKEVGLSVRVKKVKRIDGKGYFDVLEMAQ